MLRSRILSAIAFVGVLVAALVILASATPVGAQLIVQVSEVFATPIPLTGVEAENAPAPRQIYIASDPLQSPLVTPMP